MFIFCINTTCCVHLSIITITESKSILYRLDIIVCTAIVTSDCKMGHVCVYLCTMFVFGRFENGMLLVLPPANNNIISEINVKWAAGIWVGHWTTVLVSVKTAKVAFATEKNLNKKVYIHVGVHRYIVHVYAMFNFSIIISQIAKSLLVKYAPCHVGIFNNQNQYLC